MNNLFMYLAPTEPDTQIEGTTEQVIEGAIQNAQTNVGQAVEEPQVPEINEIEIDGEKLTLDQIRELKKGSLRQSDYTKKTQELSKLRKELSEAEEFYNYFKSNPELLKAMAEKENELGLKSNIDTKKLDPVQQEINELKQAYALDKINADLEKITQNDKTVSDVEILETATKYNVDVNTAYNIWRGQNFDKIVKQKEIEAKKQVATELKNNSALTSTIIKGTDPNNTSGNFGLSPEEQAMAERVGMTLEEYAKFKNVKYW